MDVQTHDKGVLAFGPFRIDGARRMLTHGGTRIKLTPRLFDTLLYLAENAGRVVEKDELLQAVWGGRVVEESNLSQTVFAVRKALRDAGATEEVIVTSPGRGYRFVAAVRPAGFADEADVIPRQNPGRTAPAPAEFLGSTKLPDSAAPPASEPSRWRVLPPLALALALALGAAALLWRGEGRHAAKFTPPPHSVAVLAFANMSGDPQQTYISDGVAEELINALARMVTLQVAARTSSFSFRDSHATAGEIGRRLNVGAVLEGSVRREGGHLRIAADLIDTTTGFMLWSHAYDGDVSSTLKTQTEIAAAAAEALRVTLGAAETATLALGGTENPAAYDAFLHGINAQQAGNEAAWAEARQDFEQAVGLDPNYAQAHAALAKALNWIASSGTMNDLAQLAPLKDRAMAEANRAIALAPDLADGYAVRAAVLEDQLDFAGAYDAIKRAAELGPGNASVLEFYGQFASRMGHVQEGEAAERRALALDPISGRAFMGLAVVYLIDGRYDDTLQALDRMKAATGRLSPIASQLAVVVALKRQQWNQAIELAGKTQGWPQAEYLAIAYHALGRVQEADAAFARLQGLQGENSNFQYAEVYAQWGQPERAIAALEAAFRARDAGLLDLRSSPFLGPVRGTPGYLALLARLEFPK